MANGAFKFKDNSGNVVSYISGSGPNIAFSGGTLDLSGMTGLTLGGLTISGSIQNAQTASSAPSYLLTSSFNTYSSSLATTGSNLFKGNQTISGSIIPAVTNTYDLGSPTNNFRDIYLSSASLYIDGTKVLGSTAQELQITTDTGQSFKILEAGSDTITLQSADGNITLTSSGGGDVIMDPTNGIIALKGTTTVYSGHKIVSSDGNSIQFGNGIAVTGSIVSTVTPLVSGSSQISYTGLSNIPSGIVSGSGQIPSLLPSGVVSGSAQTIANLPAGTVSGSAQVSYTGLSNIPSGIVSSSLQVTGYGFSTTGSNVFVGSQVITGSLYITTDLVVQGSSSLQNITASAVSIGTNTVMLNTATPALRFAGISVQDSGSNVGVTGSIYWDGLCNRWIYSNPSDIGYSGGMLLSGPRTSTLGSESPLTCNYIAKSGGGDHLYDSCIIDDGTTVCVNANLKVSGTINGTNIYGSTAVCSAVGKFTSCIDAGSGNFSGNVQLDATSPVFIANASGASYFGGLSVRQSGTEKARFAANTTHGAYVYSPTFNGFAVLSDTINPLVIASTGAATFACQVCAPAFVGGNICVTDNSCFGGDVYVYGDLRMQGTDSFIWSPSGSSTGFTGFYDGYNGQTSLVVCNSSGHLLLQPTKCNVGVGVANPGQKLEVAGVIHSFDRTNGAVNGAFYASKCGGTTSVIINSCGNTYFNGGNVGINTDTPITKLQICTTATSENVLTISNGTQQLQLGVNNGANGSYLFEKNKGLRFGTCDIERVLITDTGIACFACQVCAKSLWFSSNATGQITFGSNDACNPYIVSDSSNNLYFGNNNGYKILIPQDGSDMVFRTSSTYANPQTRLTITAAGIACFACQVCVANNIVIAGAGMFINRPAASSGEPYVFWQKDGVTRGSIYGANNAEGLRYFGASHCFEGVVCTTQGVKFASGASSLNYYEVGAWTPDVIRSSSNPTVSYAERYGSYVRVGNVVNLWFDITMSSISGGSGTYLIAGLPFTVSASMAGYSRVVWRDFTAAVPDANTIPSGFVQKGDTYIYPQNDFTGVCFGTKAATQLQAGRMTGFVSYQA